MLQGLMGEETEMVGPPFWDSKELEPEGGHTARGVNELLIRFLSGSSVVLIRVLMMFSGGSYAPIMRI